jgi:hypothetical protein
MTSHKSFFKDFQSTPPKNVVVGNGQTIQATGIGSVYLRSIATGKTFSLSDVLYVKDLTTNLVSCSELTEKHRALVAGVMEGFCKGEGISVERTVPHNPQQNGKAERMNRTLQESVRCMMYYSQLPGELEGHCFLTAIYLRNRLATETLSNKTPYEAWFGKQPDISHLRIFGCSSFANNDQAVRSKDSANAYKCILIGYGEDSNGFRGYKLLKRDTQTIIHARNVQFDEDWQTNSYSQQNQLSFQSDKSDGDFTLSDSSADPLIQNTTIVRPLSLSQADSEREDEFFDAEPATVADFPEVSGSDLPEVSGSTLRRSGRIVERQNYREPPDDLFDLALTTQDDFTAVSEGTLNDAYNSFTAVVQNDPLTVKEAMSSSDADRWKEAMKEEIDSIYKNKTWTLFSFTKDQARC